ncbi:hypothetical protein N7466_007228 [Penicillium verhagenii]|uniref:uncharacterized protein n=1 Tax=Penicillium verhagenii TaxID=1562060 RepID=UPI00254517F8|nr:uncharacterized protein N7466_007228 [Penicillium verhagenii]KAJ5928272.1 hypothetical protein N7466_007228 [Penicillium verhagenii]
MAYHKKLALVDDRPGLIVMASLFYIIQILHLKYNKILVLGLNSVFLAATIQGAITGHSEVVDDWPLTSPLEHLVEKYKYAFQIMEKMTFGLIKISILLLWKRMISPIRSFQTCCHVMIGVVIAWSIAFVFATVFQCGLNWSWNWAPITLFLTQCSNTLNMLTVFTATDIATDIVIIVLPVPIIWKLHLPTAKKAGLTGLFMLGLFTIGAGIARMYIYLVTSYDKQDNPDFIADFTLFMLWSAIEVNVGMIVCSMPVCGPVAAKIRDGFTTVLGLKHTKYDDMREGNHLTSRSKSLGGSTASCELGTCRTAIAARDPWELDDIERQLEAPAAIVVRTQISKTWKSPQDYQSHT